MTARLGALVLLVVISLGGPAPARERKSEPIKRGAYLVLVGGCDDCHTPMRTTPQGPRMEWSRRMAGHAPPSREPAGTLGKGDLVLSGSDFTSYRADYGTVFARNLTPHKSGLGDWTEAQFIKTLRIGRHQGEGRPVLPPMPWDRFGRMTDEDLKALFAYLRSLPPIDNTPPEPKVPPALIEIFARENARLAAQMTLKRGEPQLFDAGSR
jgi:hypothetical protein